jgi:hypothetical protein
MQSMRYVGGGTVANPPKTFLGTSDITPGFGSLAFTIHLRGNRHIFRDASFTVPSPLLGAMIPQPSQMAVLTEKDSSNAGFTPNSGGYNGYRVGWNTPKPGGLFGHNGMVRHSWGMTALAADGRAEWLK